MFDLSKLSTRYHVRPMHDADADALLAFCLQNDQYYRYYRYPSCCVKHYATAPCFPSLR